MNSDYDIGYGDVGYYAYGRFGSTLVDIAIVVSQTGLYSFLNAILIICFPFYQLLKVRIASY